MYFEYIMEKLDNPQDIWKDEYERKLQPVDRIFLLTLNSLTNTAIELSLLKVCFNHWLQNKKSIDLTIDQFNSTLKRLQDSFVKIIDMNGSKHISVVNPSVNDFLSALINSNSSIHKTILDNACSLCQFAKMLTSNEFEEFTREKITTGDAINLVYEDDFQRNAFFATYIPKYHVQDIRYMRFLHSYLCTPTALLIRHQEFHKKDKIIKELLTSDNISFYQLNDAIAINQLEKILENLTFMDLVDFVKLLNPLFSDSKREAYLQISSSLITEAIERLCEDVDAGDYDYDISNALNYVESQYNGTEEMDDFDFLNEVEAYIEDDIRTDIIIDIKNSICCLSEDLQKRIKFDDQHSVNVYGARRIAEAYLADENYDDDYIERGDQWDEIDTLFHKS